MIFGTGIDIIAISRIGKSIDRFSGRFEERIFTRQEIDFCRSRPNPIQHFAARFAAKEAVLKSMGVGLDGGIAWKDIEVVSETSGRPKLNLSGEGKQLFDTLGLKNIHISLSHDKTHAIAQAIAEQAP